MVPILEQSSAKSHAIFMLSEFYIGLTIIHENAGFHFTFRNQILCVCDSRGHSSATECSEGENVQNFPEKVL